MNQTTTDRTTLSIHKTYRDHGATGPYADQTIWDDTADHARITERLYSLDWPQDVTVTIAGYITAVSLQATTSGFHDGPGADTAAGVASALRALETELASRQAPPEPAQ